MASLKRLIRPFSRSLACARDVDEFAHLLLTLPATTPPPHPAARAQRLHPHPIAKFVGATRIPLLSPRSLRCSLGLGMDLCRLRLLSMAENQFTGVVPASLVGLPDLHTLNLGVTASTVPYRPSCSCPTRLASRCSSLPTTAGSPGRFSMGSQAPGCSTSTSRGAPAAPHPLPPRASRRPRPRPRPCHHARGRSSGPSPWAAHLLLLAHLSRWRGAPRRCVALLPQLRVELHELPGLTLPAIAGASSRCY